MYCVKNVNTQIKEETSQTSNVHRLIKMVQFSLVVLSFIVCQVFSQSGAKPMLEPEDTRFSYEQRLLEKLIILEQESASLRQRMETLERTASPAKVITEARLSKNQDIGANSRVMFDVEVSNVGGGFDFARGEFTAPVNGTYLMFVQTCLGGSTFLDLNIVKDGAVVGRVFSGDDAYHSCGSETVVMELHSGNKLWIVKVAGPATVLNEEHGRNSLTVVLIR